MTEQKTTPRIWIYNEANCAGFFKEGSALFKDSSPELIVEISRGSVFAHYFNLECPGNFPGICGLLHSGNEPKDFAMQVIDADYPIIFAPAEPCSPTLLGSALRNIMHHPDRPMKTDIFIELSLLEDLLPWLHGFSGIGVVYGLAYSPSESVLDIMTKLCSEELLDTAQWLGLYAYFSDAALPSDEEKSKISASLSNLPNSKLILAE